MFMVKLITNAPIQIKSDTDDDELKIMMKFCTYSTNPNVQIRCRPMMMD